MIERDRTPATARDGEDAAGGSDSQNPPKLAVGGDDEGDDEGEGEDYVYVGDDWKDVGPSLIPSIVTACLGAFLFGYHSAVINAPLADIAEDLGFGGDNFAKGAVVSIMVVGGFAGGLGIGPFADKEGRRSALVATTIPLALGTLVCGAANSLWTMMLGRFITGAGVGASTQIVPVYLSEVSPPGLRGTVNGIRRMGYVVGCLMAFQLAGPLKDANMPEGYVKPASTLNQSAGLDTYIDAVRSEGKFAVVVEKVKETAAAAERDLVVRVEEKVERLEEKLGGKGSASASAPGGDDVSGTPPSTAPTSARSPGAAAVTGADAKPAPAVKASAERSSPSEAAKSVEATDARGTEKLEKSEKSARSSAARTATETAPASGESKPDAGKRATMPDPTASERPQPQPRPQQPAIATTTTAADAAIKKSTTSPGASKAEAQRTSEAAAIAAYDTATTSSLAPKPAADAASTKAAAAAVAKSVSKESSSRESSSAVEAVEAVAVEAPSGLVDDATKSEVEELKAIVKDAAAGEATPMTPAATTISNAKNSEPPPPPAPAAGAEKAKEKAPERPAAVKSEGRTGTAAEKESAAPAAPPTKVDKDVASNAVPVSKESSPKESPKEVSRERAPTEAAPKKEKVDLEEKAAARIEEKSSKRNGDADKVKAPAAPSAPAAPAAAATSKDKPASKDKAKTASAASEVSGKSVSGSAPVKNQPPTRPTPATPTAEVVRPEPGWWRPLFYFAAIPAAAQAAGALSGVAVESPVWLLGPEGCAMESRRSLAKLLGIRGRAAVRWQEAVAGSGVVIGMGKQGRVFASVDDDEDDEETELDADGNLCAKCSFDPDESEAAVNTWGALFTEQRNRYPMIIGAGVCLLAGLSGSNTVIYYASSVLKEAGVDDPGLLTLVVGLPNVLGGVIALLCTDKYGRRPLLLWSFGGMAVCLAAFSTAAFATPGNPVNNTFCALATPVTSGGLQEGGEFVGDAMAAICDDLAAFTTATVTQRSFEPLRTTTLVAIPLYTFFFSAGAGPVPWLLYSEVFPTRIRARATAVVTAINYVCNTIVGASFLPLIGAFGLKGTYAMYAVLCAIGYVFVDQLVFETKGLALQDIEGVMLAKEAQWSGVPLPPAGGAAGGEDATGDAEDENDGEVLGSGFWWTDVGEKVERVIDEVRRSIDELGVAEVEEEAAASVEEREEGSDDGDVERRLD